MRAAYDVWFADVSATRGYGPVPIHLGTEHENPVLLTLRIAAAARNQHD